MTKKKLYKICVIGGDGIGPDVIGETLRLLKEIPLKFDLTYAEAGYGAYQKHKTPLPQKTIDLCRESDAILFGAVTTPPNIPDYFSPIVKLRRVLDLYANVRPFFSLPIMPSKISHINLIIVRENTEGLYTGRERLTPEGAVAERVITKKASERIIDFAFQLAIQKKFKKVTVVHKANILRITDGLFLKIAQEIAQKYPQIIYEDLLVDACAMKLIKKPEEFEVIVTTNMFGDILSDETAALVGGLGVAASANIGENQGLFEPVHGSAPKYAGKNRANPLASFFAACMMLEYLGEKIYADKIRNAIIKALTAGDVTVDLGGQLTMREFTDKIIKIL